jgi:hypothetical protein
VRPQTPIGQRMTGRQESMERRTTASDAPAGTDGDVISGAFAARLTNEAPELRALALRTLDEVRPPRWTLEWSLPWWLGRSLGLREDLCQAITLSTVLGLASIRLQDDLVDGDVSAADVGPATRLTDVLLREAVSIYRPLFGDESPFWWHLDATLAEWRAATELAAPGAAADPAGEVAELARRAAPLKIPAFAVCLLAGREDVFAAVERCLDHALAAMVLYDAFVDWEADLLSGRPNAFVARASRTEAALPVTSAAGADGSPAEARASVIVGMLAGDAVTSYFERIAAETTRAAALAADIPCPPLEAHLVDYGRRITAQGALVWAHHGRLTDEVTALLLGAS